MPEIEIDDIAKIGEVVDTPSYQLPPEAWSQVLNMRVVDDGLETLLGWSQVFGTPAFAPHFLLPISTQSAFFWVYVSLTNAAVFDGVDHTDITRGTVSGSPPVFTPTLYTANDTPDWNSTLLGGVPVLNNGSDVPQIWPKIDKATKLVDLPNWPSTLRAKVVRAFGPYLMAFNLTDSTFTNPGLPHTVQWSHPADPGSVPISWAYNDPNFDGGRKDFSDVNSGVLVDAMPLGSQMIIYKENSTWKCRFIGGRFVFDFGESPWVTTSGILAPRCVAVTADGGRHIVATQDDIIWHDGNNYTSILTSRQRRKLFDELDSETYVTSFMWDNPLKGEMWFCYPTTGNAYPNKALVIYYRGSSNYVLSSSDGITFRHAAVGGIEKPNDEIWDSGTDVWTDDTGPWSQLQRRRVVSASPANAKMYLMDEGVTRDGAAIATLLSRDGLGLIGRKRSGEWLEDFSIRKLVDRVWPKVQGGPVTIRLGAQETVNGPVRWGQSFVYDPATGNVADPEPVSGQTTGIEFSTTQGHWRLDGYKYNLVQLGKF